MLIKAKLKSWEKIRWSTRGGSKGWSMDRSKEVVDGPVHEGGPRTRVYIW